MTNCVLLASCLEETASLERFSTGCKNTQRYVPREQFRNRSPTKPVGVPSRLMKQTTHPDVDYADKSRITIHEVGEGERKPTSECKTSSIEQSVEYSINVE